MSRLKRSAAAIVAIGGLALLGSSLEGLVRVDGTLQAATRDAREQQRQVIQVKQDQPPGCPIVATRRL